MITVFTPTYNRGYILSKLYESLQNQTNQDFEWLVIDDGSTDGTSELFKQWDHDIHPFAIRYLYVENGGKARAINRALELAKGEYFFIVDSDDHLQPFAIERIYTWFETIKGCDGFIGVSGIRGNTKGEYLKGVPLLKKGAKFVDATNLERAKFNLSADKAEVFYTSLLRNYSFPVWTNERFVPEAVVWDSIALDGYKLRWFNEIIYNCEYQEDGLTKGSWKLLKHNPMGYALLFNSNLRYTKQWKERINLILQFYSSCFLGKEYKYLLKGEIAPWGLILIPIGFLLSVRRRLQFKKMGL